jgi:hypothetical protein
MTSINRGHTQAVVRPLGFEPRTCGLRVRCSAIELEARAVIIVVSPALLPTHTTVER